ncbi:MAG TPA: M28 family peptidase [Thermomicrobiales bacterium]|nr:M28 family peptidase [Thermomicrobiales bacterium]
MNPAWNDAELEQQVLDTISLDEPWTLIEEFSTLVRLSGSAEEAEAVKQITDRLDRWGIDYEVHHPTCLISLPGPATLRTVGDGGRSYTVKTPSFSPHTNGREVEAELVYIPGHQAAGINELFSEQRTAADVDLRGKIVMTEGLGIAARGFDLAASGAVAALFINPGNRIHEGITTTTWGSPDLDSLGRVPPVPILTINNPDGKELIAQLQHGPVKLAFSNRTDTGWRPIPVVVSEIRGNRFPDEFVLFHGHLDSWHIGIGDNATGDATLLELARVFKQHQGSLDRTLRVAWWSGHSHGRYAGSTWYADEYALDLARNCVAHVNVDSPGCRWATVYENVAWMSETESFCQSVIRDITGQDSSGEGHVLRAGDCSFNNQGVTTCSMLSSTMPQDLVAEKGYYPVGGCGGNIAWHTEDDTMEIADRDNLLRDMRVYAATLLRILNAPIAPFDYRATLTEIDDAVQRYSASAQSVIDLAPTREAVARLRNALDAFYEQTAGLNARDDAALRAANATQRAVARVLVNLCYTQDGRFKQDPARAIPAVPDLASALQLPDADDDMRRIITNQLRRGQNHLIWELDGARATIDRAMAARS